jgi:site-specific DNA recombinase
MLRAALYIRVSKEEQALHGYSLEAQKDALTKYALENDMIIVDYYIDDGYTARKRYTKRKEFMRMLNDVQQDKIDIILFIKIDRWFRSVKDYYKIQEILEAHGVDWKTTMESYDTSTANGRLHVNIRLSVAQDESDRTSERISFVFENKVSKGQVISGSVPLGFRIENKIAVHDEETVDIVRDLFNHFEQYQSKRRTRTYAREKYDINLCEATFRRMLSNPLYKGEKRGNLNFCKPIISPEQFDRIQGIAKTSNVRKTPANRIYIFTGIIACSECLHKMVARFQTAGSKNYIYYRCNQHFSRGLCSHNKEIREDYIESYLLENIEDEIKKYMVEYEIKYAAAPIKPRIDRAKIRGKLEKLKELYVNDLIGMDEYKKDYEIYMKQLEKEPEPPMPAVDFSALNDFLHSDFKIIYKSLNGDERRVLWRSVIKKLHIDTNNKIHPIFFA